MIKALAAWFLVYKYLGYRGSPVRCFFKKEAVMALYWDWRSQCCKKLYQCFDPWNSVALEISSTVGTMLLSLAGLLPSFFAGFHDLLGRCYCCSHQRSSFIQLPRWIKHIHYGFGLCWRWIWHFTVTVCVLSSLKALMKELKKMLGMASGSCSHAHPGLGWEGNLQNTHEAAWTPGLWGSLREAGASQGVWWYRKMCIMSKLS